MTKDQYRTAIETLGLSQLAAARFLGISDRTSQGYALGEYPVPRGIAMLLDLMVKHGVRPLDLLEHMKEQVIEPASPLPGE